MLRNSRFALKEWAVVVDALGTGRQLVLLRKGGIEEGERFRVEHAEFFLYPTFEHQHRNYLRPEFLPDFDRPVAGQHGSQDVLISTYAQVTDCILASELQQLHRLAPYHIWNDAHLARRFEYQPERPLYVLVLRSFEIPSIRVAFRPQYRGCKSWIELDTELSTDGARPALAEERFDALRKEVESLLECPC